ncbi:MAG TPA: choice-of-anchor Q domain-containing protein, partial [Chthoniobacterales bacterium]
GNSFFATGGIARTISTAGEIVLDRQITIVGTTANALTIRNTAALGTTSRVFRTTNIVELSGMTITGGNVEFSSHGGGIYNTGELTLFFVHVTGNSAGRRGGGLANDFALNVYHSTVSNNISTSGFPTGAGIDHFGNYILRVTNSTISGNRSVNSDTAGGGIRCVGTDTSTFVLNSTITDNQADGANSAGGLYRQGGSYIVRNSIIAGNRSNSTIADIANGFSPGAFVSNGYNIIGNRGAVTAFNQTGDQVGGNGQAIIQPRLAPLGMNGGTTPTHALLGGSPALDSGNGNGSSLDQRLLARSFDDPSIWVPTGGDNADIGAFEAQSVLVAPAMATPNPATTNEDTAIQFTLNATDPNDSNLTFSITQQPTHGTLGSISAPDCTAVNICTATVTYTPHPEYSGTDSFKFTANNGTAEFNIATVNITVNAVSDAPIITGQLFVSTAINTPRTIALADLTVTDPDSAYPGSFTLTASDGANYTRSGNQITPPTNFVGTLLIPVKVNDGALDSNSFTFKLRVNPRPEDLQTGMKIQNNPGGAYVVSFIANPG